MYQFVTIVVSADFKYLKPLKQNQSRELYRSGEITLKILDRSSIRRKEAGSIQSFHSEIGSLNFLLSLCFVTKYRNAENVETISFTDFPLQAEFIINSNNNSKNDNIYFRTFKL